MKQVYKRSCGSFPYSKTARYPTLGTLASERHFLQRFPFVLARQLLGFIVSFTIDEASELSRSTMPFTPPPPSGASGGIKSTGSSMLRQRPSQIPRLTSDVDARHRAAAEAAASIIVKQQAAAAFPGKWEFPQHIEREPHDVEQYVDAFSFVLLSLFL